MINDLTTLPIGSQNILNNKITSHLLLKSEKTRKFNKIPHATFIDEDSKTPVQGMFNHGTRLNFALPMCFSMKFILNFIANRSIITVNKPTKPLPEAQIGGFFYACCFSLNGGF